MTDSQLDNCIRAIPQVLTAATLALAPAWACALTRAEMVFTNASYSVALGAVVAPNQSIVTVPGANDVLEQQRAPGALSGPVPVQVGGGADTGPNYNGLGYANGSGTSRAEMGVLKAAVVAESQVVAQPGSNVGARVTSIATAEFQDRVIFTSATPGTLVVSGTLQLTGTMLGTGYGQILVGGTGIGPSGLTGEYYAENSGLLHPGHSPASLDWVPGTPLTIPFTFGVTAGVETTLDFYLKATAKNSGSFGPCAATGGLCDVVTLSQKAITVDYSHTLTWGGLSVTDAYGTPVAFTVASQSGFDYSVPYPAAAVPEVGTWGLMLAGLGLMGARGLRRRQRVA